MVCAHAPGRTLRWIGATHIGPSVTLRTRYSSHKHDRGNRAQRPERDRQVDSTDGHLDKGDTDANAIRQLSGWFRSGLTSALVRGCRGRTSEQPAFVPAESTVP